MKSTLYKYTLPNLKCVNRQYISNNWTLNHFQKVALFSVEISDTKKEEVPLDRMITSLLLLYFNHSVFSLIYCSI